MANSTTSRRVSPSQSAIDAAQGGLKWLGVAATLLAPPVLRISLALPFFRSGLTRWDGFLSLAPSATYLFQEMLKLHIFGGEYGFPFPSVVAELVGTAEIVLPILLILGIGTRLVAFGLLLMTAIIQLVVPDGWVNFHLYWAAIALAIMALGGGPLSVDRLIVTFFPARRRAPV